MFNLAQDDSVPLLERLRFPRVSASNLDEFFEVRVVGPRQQLEGGFFGTGPDGFSSLLQA